MHAAPIVIAALCVSAIAYRYYSAFLAAKVMVLDDTRITPAHRLKDGHNYDPTKQVGSVRPPFRRHFPEPARSSARCWPRSLDICPACCGWSSA